MKLNITIEVKDAEVAAILEQFAAKDSIAETTTVEAARKIKSRMRELGVDAVWLSDKIGIGTATLSNKINAKYPFTTEEAYKLLRALKIPDSEIGVYFPPWKTQGVKEKIHIA